LGKDGKKEKEDDEKEDAAKQDIKPEDEDKAIQEEVYI